jgi:hypothetical protein
MSTFYSDVLASSRSTKPSYDSTMNINSFNIIYIELFCNCGLQGAWEVLGQERNSCPRVSWILWMDHGYYSWIASKTALSWLSRLVHLTACTDAVRGTQCVKLPQCAKKGASVDWYMQGPDALMHKANVSIKHSKSSVETYTIL